eukprot:2531803-Prymnesium_polylepis.1
MCTCIPCVRTTHSTSHYVAAPILLICGGCFGLRSRVFSLSPRYGDDGRPEGTGIGLRSNPNAIGDRRGEGTIFEAYRVDFRNPTRVRRGAWRKRLRRGSESPVS